MREIVTLQLGSLSNYAATHFWNAQESYFTYSKDQQSVVDHDIHWRPGIASDGTETFLPRTVIYDLKGGFGSLRKINALYEAEAGEAEASSLWSGKQVVQKQQPLEPSAYQQSLDTGTETPKLSSSSVRYWSDYSRVFYHPRSLVQLYDYELHSSIQPFERYEMGLELFDNLDKEHDIVDRDFRPFVEECDNMQGVQIFSTLDDAWGGFAGRYMAEIRDEYPKACVWLWGLTSPMGEIPREKRQLRISNTAQSMAEACSSASMVVPLTLPERMPPSVNVDSKSSWQVSAAFTTAIETATLESRLAAGRDVRTTNLWDIVESLNTGGNQKLARMRMGVGSEAGALGEDNGGVDFFGLARLRDSSEHIKKGRVFGQLSSVRGVPPKQEEATDEREPRTRRLVGDSVFRRFDSELKFPLLDSFPHIYADEQSEISVETFLSTETGMGAQIKLLKTQAAWSVPLDERENLANGLAEIADAYADDWESGSDEDDDDL